MHGGKREGAGRKPAEPTVRISVPVGVLDKVNALVQAYRQSAKGIGYDTVALPLKQPAEPPSLKTSQEIKDVPVRLSEPDKPKTNSQRKHEQRLARLQAKKARKHKG